VASDVDINFLASLAPGSGIDGFRVINRIHAGGTAHLFRVELLTGPDPGFPLVMKVPRVGHDQPTESILGYETEAMILPALHGPHVPRFVAAGDLASVPHLTMEWVQGTGLAAIAAEAPLSAKRVAVLGAALADAMHALHQQNVIHHDIKPDNVIIRDDGIAVLLDFGFAHHAHFPDYLAEEKRYASGSAPYVSPEQLTGSREDSRGDIFALGVVLYELATGRLPFGVPDTLNAMKNRLWASPTPPRARVASIPPWLQEIILRCLEPDPAARYQSAAHVAVDLRNSERVLLTARATRTERVRFMTQFKLWWRSRHQRRTLRKKPQVLISQSPVIMVAVDTSHPDDERHPALQWTVRQLASLNLEFRLICVSAIRAASVGESGGAADTSSGLQLVHKVRLHNWIEPLRLPPSRLSLHVLESGDPAATLLDFAKSNNVDLIVLGAPAPNETAMAWWRSVASTVTANAHCSVHVVRVPSRSREDWKGSPATLPDERTNSSIGAPLMPIMPE
jgi:eukaryotic-like serine/threonine-protein kinase